MAIPKEPRQLMINLMYLVLTAMLALNVSAEIINAFFILDKGLKKNNHIVEHAVESVISGMEETAKTKTQYQKLVEEAKRVEEISKDFHTFIDQARERMVEESGGAYTAEEAEQSGHPELVGKPKGKKDKETPQRIFVSGDYGSEGKKEPLGPQLDAMVQELRQKYVDFVAELWKDGGIKGTIFADSSKKKAALEELVNEITLTSSEAYNSAAHENKTWSEYTFGYMPVAALYPMLRKFQNDARTSEAAVVNFLAGQMGKLEMNYDQFDVFSQSPKPYILLGETYETEIALGAYSSQADFSVSVGGRSLKIENGKAKYTASGSSVGQKTYTAKISVNNPLTGETETFSKDFHYEVGQPSVNVSADKMNVFYIGVDNPVTIAAAGITTSNLSVSMSGCEKKSSSGTNYVITSKKQGKAIITVKDKSNGKSFPFEFRVKRIPDPVVRLGNKDDGGIKNGEMKAQRGLIPWLDNFDFDAKCKIQTYTLYYTRKRQDAIRRDGTGGSFSGEVLNLVRSAKPGDQYAFTDVKVRCPGDAAARRVNSLAFQVR
jgi:hypothetical protein